MTAITLALAAATVCAVPAAQAEERDSSDKIANFCRIRVHGGILAKYMMFGSDKGRLGCPLGIERVAAGGGRMQQFDGGTIYWLRATGAFLVTGVIRDRWQQHGGEGGCLGYPVGEQYAGEHGPIQRFQYGWVGADSASCRSRLGPACEAGTPGCQPRLSATRKAGKPGAAASMSARGESASSPSRNASVVQAHLRG
ncbi:LGFP repeat-containing protein [Actinoplanes siamensis]|uniref:LGFP repeat-containing protein n=1 Tax=Actinoplanes siamensis TaxID=1223317 RepID=UPI001943C451|nr:hypothetical protein [Actinoplanes siamensis]